MDALPAEALANVLRRLQPGDLAVARGVRRTWRAAVDAGRLLPLPHLFPRSLQGIFINYIDHERPHCFSRPSSSAAATNNGSLAFLPGYTEGFNPVIDHCNGLLLYQDSPTHYVANPATRRWDRFRTKHDHDRNSHAHLVFDPALSPHYQVFFVPDVPKKSSLVPVPQDPRDDSMEWPPSSWTLSVFSSSPRRWQNRPFLRQGHAAGTVASARADPIKPASTCCNGPRWRYGVYWRRSLYVHCRGLFVARFSLSAGTYQVIKLPKYAGESKHAHYLGKSQDGVCLATIHEGYRLRVCNLAESNGQIHWVLNYYVDLEPCTSLWLDDLQVQGFDKTWTLDDVDCHGDGDDGGDNDYDSDGNGEDENGHEEEHEEDEEEEKMEEKGGGGGENDGLQNTEISEWDSDDDNVLNIEDGYEECYGNVYFLGFHPYKEVIFLGLPGFTGVAYHLESSKIQYLGKMRPKDYYQAHTNGMYEAYMYTPCMIGVLRKQASASRTG